MYHPIRLLQISVWLCLALLPGSVAAAWQDAQLLRPHQVTGDGTMFQLAKVELDTADLDPALRTNAVAMLAEHHLPVGTGGTPLRLRVDSTLPQEGYRLTLAENDLLVEAATPTGMRRAILQLGDLLTNNDLRLPRARIESAPSFAMRGAFLSWRSIEATPEKIANLKALLKAFAQLGINTLIIEFADNIQYDTTSFPARAGKAFTKAQIRELLEVARANDIEIIPYFQALSHCVWILSNPANTQLLETPDNTSWHTAWCPSKPELRTFFEPILEETITLFQPRYIHLAYDEINYGPYHQCEACRQKTPEKLLLDSIMADYQFLHQHQVGLMLFHDQLIESQNTSGAVSQVNGWKILGQLPRDIVINLWLYGNNAPEMRRQLDYFADLGFATLGAGFEDLRGLQTFAQTLEATPNARGLITTYWFRAGDWSNFQIAPVAAAATSVTAAVSWNPEVDFTTGAIDVVAALNVPWLQWSPPDPKSWLWQALPASGLSFGSAPCQWPGPNYTALGALTSSGNQSLPATLPADQPLWSVSGRPGDGLEVAAPPLTVNRRADELIFVHAAGLPDNQFALSYLFGSLSKPLLGHYRIAYADGTEELLPLHYNGNIADWNSTLGALHSERLYHAAATDGTLFHFSTWRWVNTHPDKVISVIHLESAHYEHTALLNAAVFGRFIPPLPLLLDGFNYTSRAQLQQHWTVNTSGLKPGGVAINPVPPLTEGGGAIQLLTAGSAESSARITLDLPIDWSTLTDLSKRLFAIDIDTQTPVQVGIYIGNDNWSSYRVTYVTLANGFNRINFALDGMTAEAGNLALADATQLRLSFFLPGSPEPISLTLDNLNCSPPGSDGNLNRKPWYQ